MPKSQPSNSPEKPVKAEPVKAVKTAATGEKPNGEKKGHDTHTGNDGIFTMTDDGRAAAADAKLTPFLRRQKERLIQLRDNMLDSMTGVAKDTLRSRAEGSEA